MDYELNALEKCICCGAEVHSAPDASSVQCSYCRTVMSVTRFSKKEKQLAEEISRLHGCVEETNSLLKDYLASADGKLLRLYRQAEEAQQAGRFEEAIALYKQVIVACPQEEAELHWRVMLCRYGVQYVREQSSGECLPTITRMVVDSVLNDEDYLAARQLAPDSMAQMYYVREARRINDILRDYLEINGTETPYDVFISVKQGDEKGKPTDDSVTGMELYHMLDKLGLKVFNSRISLQQYSGCEYEPYIMHALSTAKVMILVASCEEYMNSPWLKNEWSRFRWLQKNDDSMSRSLITYVIGKDKWNMLELGKIQLIYALTHSDPKAALRTAVESACGKNKQADTPVTANVQGIDPAVLAQALAILQQQAQQNTPVQSPASAPAKPSISAYSPVPPTPEPQTPPAPDPSEPTPLPPRRRRRPSFSESTQSTPVTAPIPQTPPAPAPSEPTPLPPRLPRRPSFSESTQSTPVTAPASDAPSRVNDSTEVVQIKDVALEGILREALNKSFTEPITAGELSRLVKLSGYKKGISDISPLRYCTSLQELSLSHNNIADISPLSDLIALTSLHLRDNRIADVSALSDLTELVFLDLSGNRIGSIAPLKKLTKLIRLKLNISSYSLRFMEESCSFKPLAAANHIKDISPLSGMRHLAELNLAGNRISDISPLSGLTELIDLNLKWNGQIADISPLSSMTNLTELRLSGNRISSIAPLGNITLLTHLELSHNRIDDISSLSDMTALTRLDLKNNQIGSISALTNLTALTNLYLGSNHLTDISPLAGLSALSWLHLDSNRITNLSPLTNLTALTHLYLNGNQIADISALSGLKILHSLYLNDNRISDISPLSSLTTLEWLALKKNPLSDISPLGSLNELTALYLDNRIPGVGILSRNSTDPSAKLIAALRARRCSINPNY